MTLIDTGRAAFQVLVFPFRREGSGFIYALFRREDARATMPVVAVTGEFTWGPEVLVIQEYAFGVGIEGRQLRLSDEHTEHGWCGFDDACKAVDWDSNRTALWELDHRLRHGLLALT